MAIARHGRLTDIDWFSWPQLLRLYRFDPLLLLALGLVFFQFDNADSDSGACRRSPVTPRLPSDGCLVSLHQSYNSLTSRRPYLATLRSLRNLTRSLSSPINKSIVMSKVWYSAMFHRFVHCPEWRCHSAVSAKWFERPIMALLSNCQFQICASNSEN